MYSLDLNSFIFLQKKNCETNNRLSFQPFRLPSGSAILKCTVNYKKFVDQLFYYLI